MQNAEPQKRTAAENMARLKAIRERGTTINNLHDAIINNTMPLPNTYSTTLELTKGLVKALYELKKSRRVCSFENVKSYVENFTRHSFSDASLSTILGITPPGAITVEWISMGGRTTIKKTFSRRIHLNEKNFDIVIETAEKNLRDTLNYHYSKFVQENGHGNSNESIFEKFVRNYLQKVPLPAGKPLPPMPIDDTQQRLTSLFQPKVEIEDGVSAIPMAEVERIRKSRKFNQEDFFKLPTIAKAIQEKQKRKLLLANSTIDLEKEKNNEVLKTFDWLHYYYLKNQKKAMKLQDLKEAMKWQEVYAKKSDNELNSLFQEISSKTNNFFKIHNGAHLLMNRDGYDSAKKMLEDSLELV